MLIYNFRPSKSCTFSLNAALVSWPQVSNVRCDHSTTKLCAERDAEIIVVLTQNVPFVLNDELTRPQKQNLVGLLRAVRTQLVMSA